VETDPVTVSTRTRCNGRVLTPDGTLADRSYELLEEVGRGAAATVWRARERASGREVAVKVLHEEYMSSSKAVARFLQERSILLSLRHPNIVRVRDLLTTTDGALALVMDLVHGGNLRGFLDERGTLPPAEAATLLAQVAEGLAAAHARSVVHRDLKPDNVLVDRDLDGSPRVRLTDFGIARILDAPGMTTPGAVVGTPNYMAPELIEGGEPSPAVDVYALGMMFYELLVGRPPYADQSQSAILLRHLRAVRRPRAGIPKPAWALIQSCVQRDPSRRPVASALAGALRRIATEMAGRRALPRRIAGAGPRPVVASRRAALSAAAVAAVLVATAAVGFSGRHLLSGGESAEADGAGAGRSGMGIASAAGRADVERSRVGTRPTGAPTPPAAAPAPGRSLVPEAGVTASVAVPLPTAFGPWRCDPTSWVPGHPAVASPCVATGPAVRIRADMKAAPGVKVDLSVSLQDADSNAEAASPRTCAGLEFTQAVIERSCGTFDFSPLRGHRYVVVVRWKYLGDMSAMQGGTVRGEALAW
jgi:serine/threonine-protein kinase